MLKYGADVKLLNAYNESILNNAQNSPNKNEEIVKLIEENLKENKKEEENKKCLYPPFELTQPNVFNLKLTTKREKQQVEVIQLTPNPTKSTKIIIIRFFSIFPPIKLFISKQNPPIIT